MFHKSLFYTSCLICLFLSSCVTKGTYTDLETNSNSQLKEKNDSLSDLQTRHNELQSENARLSGTIEGLKRNLSQAQSAIRQQEDAIGELKLALAQTQPVVQQKEMKISELDRTRREIGRSLKD